MFRVLRHGVHTMLLLYFWKQDILLDFGKPQLKKILDTEFGTEYAYIYMKREIDKRVG